MFSDPVVGDAFFGRQEVLDLLAKRTNALKSGYRQNVAIIGHQQVGKTSILRQFLHTHRDPAVLAIYVEIKLLALDYFVDQFVRALLYQYLTGRAAVEPTESATSLAEKAKALVPQTVARIHEITALLHKRHAEEAYSKLFSLTTVLRQETGLHCVVVLDEFHRLGELGIRNAFSDFGKRIMVQKDTMYLLSSSSFSASRKILAEKLSLLFGNFERVYLEPFDFETSFAFIAKRLEPLRIPEDLRYFLVGFTDGHPFFLGTILGRLREHASMRGEGEVTRRSVGEVLLKLLFESQGVFYQYFQKLLEPWTRPGARGSHVLLLTELAKGKNKLKDLAAAVNRSQKETSDQLGELMGRELLVKTGVFFRFHDKMFKFWLREVYEKKELSLLGTSGKIEDFLRRIDETISEYEELRRLDVSARVQQLFSQFRNEIVELGEKRRQLPHFTEILEGRPAGVAAGSPRHIIAKGHGRCWVCKIVEERASERDVLELVEGAPRAGRSASTKVLIALSGLDDNAKLLAKEKRVFALGLSRLNVLMDVYGRAPLIREAAAAVPAEAAVSAPAPA